MKNKEKFCQKLLQLYKICDKIMSKIYYIGGMIMKRLKQIISMVLAAILFIGSLSLTAVAAETSNAVKIQASSARRKTGARWSLPAGKKQW